jgi:hypothetical protein
MPRYGREYDPGYGYAAEYRWPMRRERRGASHGPFGWESGFAHEPRRPYSDRWGYEAEYHGYDAALARYEGDYERFGRYEGDYERFGRYEGELRGSPGPWREGAGDREELRRTGRARHRRHGPDRWYAGDRESRRPRYGYDPDYRRKSRWETDQGDPFRDRERGTPIRMIHGQWSRYDQEF